MLACGLASSIIGFTLSLRLLRFSGGVMRPSIGVITVALGIIMTSESTGHYADQVGKVDYTYEALGLITFGVRVALWLFICLFLLLLLSLPLLNVSHR
jgi:hypothetical protein